MIGVQETADPGPIFDIFAIFNICPWYLRHLRHLPSLTSASSIDMPGMEKKGWLTIASSCIMSTIAHVALSQLQLIFSMKNGHSLDPPWPRFWKWQGHSNSGWWGSMAGVQALTETADDQWTPIRSRLWNLIQQRCIQILHCSMKCSGCIWVMKCSTFYMSSLSIKWEKSLVSSSCSFASFHWMLAWIPALNIP